MDNEQNETDWTDPHQRHSKHRKYPPSCDVISGPRDFWYLTSRRHDDLTSHDDVTRTVCSLILGQEHGEEEEEEKE